MANDLIPKDDFRKLVLAIVRNISPPAEILLKNADTVGKEFPNLAGLMVATALLLVAREIK